MRKPNGYTGQLSAGICPSQEQTDAFPGDTRLLVRMMLAGVTVADSAVAELASLVRDVGAIELADRLERARHRRVRLLAPRSTNGRVGLPCGPTRG